MAFLLVTTAWRENLIGLNLEANIALDKKAFLWHLIRDNYVSALAGETLGLCLKF